jgi:parvulin-like peptidyl-prolyl isomerase
LVEIMTLAPMKIQKRFSMFLCVAIFSLTFQQVPPTVALVWGDPVPLTLFQQRVRLVRWQTGQQLLQIVAQYGAKALTDPTSPYAHEYDLLTDSKAIGQQTLDQLITVQLLQHEAASRNITVTDAEIDAQISSTFGISPTASPTDAAVLTANRDNYLGGAGVAAKMSQADLRTYFGEQVLQTKVYVALTAAVPQQAEQIKVRHILVDSVDKANALLAQIKQGASFADLAKTNSQDTTTNAQGGDLGWAPRGVYDPDFDSAIWAGTVGSVIGPVKTKLGYHLILIEDRAVRPLDQADYIRAKNAAYQTWLRDAHDRANIQVISNWVDYVPPDPTPADLGLPVAP